MDNSFILREEEKKRIKKLYEATSASSSGSFEQPMAFSQPTTDLEITDVFIDGDNIADGSEELTVDLEDLALYLDLSEEDEAERIREIHKKNSTIKSSK